MKQIEMYRVPSHLGGSFDVSIVKELPDNKVELRIWYGVARTGYWEGWEDFDGKKIIQDKSTRTKPRIHTISR